MKSRTIPAASAHQKSQKQGSECSFEKCNLTLFFNCFSQQMPAAIGLQIGPVDHDHGPYAAYQSTRHGRIDVAALGMQMAIAQQAIQCLQGCAHTLGVRPGARQVDQRQSPPVNRRLDGAQQHAVAQGMHRSECVAQALLQYFGRAHGGVSSGLVTREE